MKLISFSSRCNLELVGELDLLLCLASVPCARVGRAVSSWLHHSIHHDLE